MLRWFYCLPISAAMLCLVLLTLCFWRLKRRYGMCRWWLVLLRGLLALSIGLIWYVTIGNRTSGSVIEPSYRLFHSYREVMNGGSPEILRSNWMNVFLFYPAALFVSGLVSARGTKGWKLCLTILLFAAVSVGIEWIQYRYALGNAEIDDIFHNTVGAFLGSMAGSVRLDFSPEKG